MAHWLTDRQTEDAGAHRNGGCRAVAASPPPQIEIKWIQIL